MANTYDRPAPAPKTSQARVAKRHSSTAPGTKVAVREALATLRYVIAFDGQALSADSFAVVAKRCRKALAGLQGGAA